MAERIVIRCDKRLKSKFRKYVIENGFRNQADALSYLLDRAEREGWKKIVW